MIRRMLLLVVAVLFVLVPAAAAQTYGTPGITTSAPLIPGTTVTVSACCYVPGTIVTFTLRSSMTGNAAPAEPSSNGLYVRALKAQVSQTYTATAGADGTASVTITVPADAQGTVTVGASGTPLPGTPASNEIEVTIGQPSTGAATGGLPVTGTDSTLPLSIIAVLLLAGGGAALLAGRRRDERDSEPSSTAV